MEQLVRIANTIVARDKLATTEWQSVLAKMYSAHERASCTCSGQAAPMYVTRRGALFYLARIPGSGIKHHPACPSFDMDDNEAVTTEADGRLRLTADFPLHSQGKSAPANGSPVAEIPSSAQKSDRSNLDQLLRVIWRKSELNRWYPRMKGKRSWFVVRRCALEAAEEISIGSLPLEGMLFVPAVFDRDNARTQHETNLQTLSHLCPNSGSRKQYALLLGMVKVLTRAKYDYQVQIRHLPDMQFYMRESLAAKLGQKYPFEIAEIFAPTDSARCIALLLIERSDQGNFNIVDIGLMKTNRDFIPVENVFEEDLINHLIEDGRAFLRAERTTESNGRRPTAYLTDTGATPSHLIISTAPPQSDSLPYQWIWYPHLTRLSVAIATLPQIATTDTSTT